MSEKRCYAMETKIEINDNFLEMEIFQFFCCVHGHHPPLKTRGLSRQLKALEEDGLIIRTEYAQIPPKVEYSLSDIGTKFHSVLVELEKWGNEYIKSMEDMKDEN